MMDIKNLGTREAAIVRGKSAYWPKQAMAREKRRDSGSTLHAALRALGTTGLAVDDVHAWYTDTRRRTR